MPQTHPYQTYQKTHVQTADQAQLILMLYDGAIRFLRKGKAKICVGDMEGAHNYLVRGRSIIIELLSTLRPEKAGKIGANLEQLYTYLFHCLVEANLKKDAAMVEDALRILLVLREGWATVKKGETTPSGQPKSVTIKT